MNSKLKLFVAVIVVSVISMVIGYGIGIKVNDSQNRSQQKVTSTSDSSNHTDELPNTTGQPVSIVGTIGCLYNKDPLATQTMGCAIGLTSDEGTGYALGSDSPMDVGEIPSGQRIEVNGILTPDETSMYKIRGTIQVQSIRQL